MKRIITLTLTALALVLAILIVRTLRLHPQSWNIPPANTVNIDATAAAERLAGAIRISTVSFQDTAQIDYRQFLRLHDYLANQFPRVHQSLTRTVINSYSLLYSWPGTDPSLQPLLLMAHQDVVPVPEDNREKWQVAPFAGVVDQGYIWGRGTMDDKVALMSILEAVETLLQADFVPRRTVLLAFGHDEEIGGFQGARRIAEYLRERSLRPEFILDEGGTVISGVFPGVDRPVALIGTAEKGYLTLTLTARGPGGHSSMPPAQSAVGILSAALQRVETHPLPAGISGPVRQLFLTLAPEMGFFQRLAFANLWLFGGAIRAALARQPTTNALIRTTTALTMVQGGVKENVLPTEARGVVNFRLKPGDTVENVVDHVTRVVDDPRVVITVVEGAASDASPVADTATAAYRTVARTVHQIFPEAIVAPWLLVGATDTRHFTDLTTNIYRFIPRHITGDDVERIHGIDERIGVDQYRDCIRFYAQLIRNAASQTP
jgi:carboxypeptidase PM20D1